MRNINIATNVYGSLISLVLTVYLLSGGRWQQKANRGFAAMCCANIVAQMFDIATWVFEGTARPWFPLALRVGVFGYFISAVMVCMCYTAYVLSYFSLRAKISPLFWKVALVLCGLFYFCVFLSPWNGMVYEIVEGNLYRRGEYFHETQLLWLAVCMMDLLVLFLHRACLRPVQIFSFISFLLFPLVLGGVQNAFYGVSLVNIGVTLSVLLIFVNIHADQETQLTRQETQLAEARIDMMMSQINPHFLYNALTAIRQLCDIDPAKAKSAITDFSRFLRANMDALTNKAPIPFELELNHTKHYLNLEQQRFGERLSVQYDIQVQNFALPPLTLQPIAENAVRHGILLKEGGGNIRITASETSTAYVVSVFDDGVGFSHHEKPDGKQHIGISNVKKRLAALCGGTLTIESTPETGSVVSIIIPKEEKL